MFAAYYSLCRLFGVVAMTWSGWIGGMSEIFGAIAESVG